MENVPKAPEPEIDGYSVCSFLIDNASIEGPDGLGQEQERLRRFSFGVRMSNERVAQGRAGAWNISRSIPRAALLLPKRAPAVTTSAREVPVKIGGSGRLKGRLREGAVCSYPPPGQRFREATVTASGTEWDPEKQRPVGKKSRKQLQRSIRLQGLPEGYELPGFTVDGALKAIGNGVPLPLGRAMARAVRDGLRDEGLAVEGGEAR